MDKYTSGELEDARKIVSSAISRCEKSQPKFAEGTSQSTLLKNRIKALYISKALIENEDTHDKYSKNDLEKAIAPVASIISKCQKAQVKFKEGTQNHTRFKNMIKAMTVSKTLIEEEISTRD